MEITSALFKHGEHIPKLFTCLDRNINPPLNFAVVPPKTKSLVLIFEDVDAAPKPWIHWILFDIPPETTELTEGTVPPGATEGLANNHSFGYEGPCPKYFKDTHHYWFRLYALDTKLNLPPVTEREEVEEKMKAHVIGKAEMLVSCSAPE